MIKEQREKERLKRDKPRLKMLAEQKRERDLAMPALKRFQTK